MAMQHNTAMGRRSNISPQRIRRLPFDKKSDFPEWTPDDAIDLINKWPDIPKN